MAGHGAHEALLRLPRGELDRLGAAGETAVLWACLQKKQTTVTVLLGRYPELVLQVYAAGNPDYIYAGENLLHIAIVQKDLALGQRLLGAGGGKFATAQLEAAAVGTFFTPPRGTLAQFIRARVIRGVETDDKCRCLTTGPREGPFLQAALFY